MKKNLSRFPSLRILIAEDYEFNLEIFVQFFESFGIQTIDTAADGEAVLDKMRQQGSGEAYDILFLDLDMPKKSGYEVVEEIKKLYPQPPLLVAITASAFPEDKEKCLQAGFDEYLCKPLVLEEIESFLKKHFPEKVEKA